MFSLEQDEDDWPPYGSETMWAVETGTANELVLDNIPLFVTDLAVGDRILVSEQDPFLIFERLIENAGHSTVCVVLEDDVSPKPVRDALRELGCPSELYGQLGIVVIDVPPSVDYSPVREILDRGERDGEWEFHEPALRHADPDDG